MLQLETDGTSSSAWDWRQRANSSSSSAGRTLYAKQCQPRHDSGPRRLHTRLLQPAGDPRGGGGEAPHECVAGALLAQGGISLAAGAEDGGLVGDCRAVKQQRQAQVGDRQSCRLRGTGAADFRTIWQMSGEKVAVQVSSKASCTHEINDQTGCNRRGLCEQVRCRLQHARNQDWSQSTMLYFMAWHCPCLQWLAGWRLLLYLVRKAEGRMLCRPGVVQARGNAQHGGDACQEGVLQPRVPVGAVQLDARSQQPLCKNKEPTVCLMGLQRLN